MSAPLTGVGLALWAGLIAVPLGLLAVAAVGAGSPGSAGPAADVVIRSIALAAGVAVAAVVLGYVPGKMLAATRRGRGGLLFLLLLPLLLPRYLLYYAWGILQSPTSTLGAYISQHRELANLVGVVTSALVMVLWYWPLAALVIAQGWRTMDRQAWRIARLDAGSVRRFVSVTLPLMAWPLVMAGAVCFVLVLAEFGTFHLAGLRTIGTELAVLYELTGSEGAVARSAWPMAMAALAVAVLLWRRGGRSWINVPIDDDAAAGSRGEWAVVAVLAAVSLAVPVGLLIASASDLSGVIRMVTARGLGRELLVSLAVAAAGAVAALTIAAGAVGLTGRRGAWRLIGGAVAVTILLATLLPGSIVALSLLRALSGFPPLAPLRQSMWIVPAGQAARFAGVALILLSFVRDARHRHLAEMAATDGASWLGAWRWVHLPRLWPTLVGCFLILVMFGMTELPATMVLLPAGVPNFAQSLLNRMHTLRDREVITWCLSLMACYAVLAAAAVALLRPVGPGRGAS